MTKYAVMYQAHDGTYDLVSKDMEAHSSEDAARKAAGLITLGGEFIAFPSRNVEPISVALEQTPRAVVKRKAPAE